MNPCRTRASPPPPFPCPETTLNSAQAAHANDASYRPSRIHTGYHGVLAPHARWRGRAVAHGRPESGAPAEADAVHPDRAAGCSDPAPETRECREPADAAERPGPTGGGKPRYWTWANLMRRAFDLDVLACPRCGGRMSLIATIDDPRVIRKILGHLGLATEVPQPRPSRSPPAPSDLFSDLPA